ncbi:MAG: formate dehydrogenase subunit delta [Roseiarcus sp.]
MSSEKRDKLVRMANQIGDYFKAMPESEAVNGAADHLRLYWTPKMVGEIIAYAESGQAGLNAIAERAVAELKRRSVL